MRRQPCKQQVFSADQMQLAFRYADGVTPSCGLPFSRTNTKKQIDKQHRVCYNHTVSI